MSNSDPVKPSVIFIEVPQVITAKIVRERSWHIRWPSKISWRGKLGLSACVLLFVLIGWSTLRNRIFLPELMAVGFLTLIGLLGINRLMQKNRTIRSSILGILLMVASTLGFIMISVPPVQRGYARAHLVRAIRSQGLSIDVTGDAFSGGAGWLEVRKGVLVPRLLVDLIGGPAMLMSIERIELPQDMLSPQVVDALHEPTAKYATYVDLRASRSKRPPDTDSFQKLLSTAKLWYVDATWFDADTFRMLNLSPQPTHIMVFDGYLSDDVLPGLCARPTTSLVSIHLANLQSNELSKLARLMPLPKYQPLRIRSFTLNHCELTPDSARMFAMLNHPVEFTEFEPENITLAAQHAVRLYHFPWHGKLTKQTAESFAKNKYLNYITGTIEPEAGAIEALSQSATLQGFSIAKKPVTKEDIECLLRMPALYKVHFENCTADFEMLQRLAAKPGMNTITITNGPLTPAQLQQLRKATTLGSARLFQANFDANRSGNSSE
jgi:hypothetical protein